MTLTPERKPIDTDTLFEACMGNMSLVAMLLDRFEKQLAADIVSMEAAVASGDDAGLASTAHALKGASGALAAFCLRDLAARVEHAVRENAPGGGAPHLGELRHEVERCIAYLPSIREMTRAETEKGRAA